MFERTEAKIRLHRICKALGVEPYPEMVRYVIDRDETMAWYLSSLYECDPQKNTECNKRNCGNPCKHTTRKEFAREPSGSELLGKVVVITQMRKIPTAYAYCKYYENMGGNRGRGSDGACTARGTLYATRGIRVSKERLDNCPLRIITGGRE